MLGEPSGLSARIEQHPESTIAAGIAYNLNGSLLLQADRISYGPRLTEISPAVRTYYGLGGVIAFNAIRKADSEASLAIRVPLGLEWRRERLEAFVKLTRGIGILPGTFGMLNGSLGARYRRQP